MAQRDVREQGGRRGARAAARSRGPDFLLSDGLEEEDDMDGSLLSGMKRRTRRQYDERRDMDDMDGIEDVGLRANVYRAFLPYSHHRNYQWSNLVTSKLNQSSSGSSPNVSAGQLSSISVTSLFRTWTSMAILYMERGYETSVKVSTATFLNV